MIYPDKRSRIADVLEAIGRGDPATMRAADTVDIQIMQEQAEMIDCDEARCQLDDANELIRQIDAAATAKGNMITRLQNVLKLLEELN